MGGQLPWQEEQSLSAGVVRDYRRAIYIPPAWDTTYTYCQVEATSKAFAVPPVTDSVGPRPTGMIAYRTDAFYIRFGSRQHTSVAQAALQEAFYTVVGDTMGGWVPAAVAWSFPLHPSVNTVFVYATTNTSLLQASWVFGK